MSYFGIEYTIHFDDTMAYGSHHFLTAFKFQCAARESLLFGARIFDEPGVRECLDGIHLYTVDAYARNLNPASLGNRVAILLTQEEWGRASTRFCFRVIDEAGRPICAGFQTVLCADAETGKPMPLPQPLWNAMQQMRDIEERRPRESFRDLVLAGGSKTDSLFTSVECETARRFLTNRYPSPQVIAPVRAVTDTVTVGDQSTVSEPSDDNPVGAVAEAWVFAGQGAYAPDLLSSRIGAYRQLEPTADEQLNRCAEIAQQLLGGDAGAVVSGGSEDCSAAIKATPELSQVAIHLQNMLGAALRGRRGYRPSVLVGHSFGEIAALGVAGCFDLPVGVRIVSERARAIAEHAPPTGALLAVACSRSQLATETGLLGLDHVVIAGRNHAQQTLASGPRDQLERLRDHLHRADIGAVMVPTPTSFHHPALKTAAAAWLRQLRSLPLKAPTLPVYSPIGRRTIVPGDDIAVTLAGQFLRPFDLQGAINDVVGTGVTRLVDCGSTGATARILSKAVPDGIEVGGIELGTTMDQGARHARPQSPAPSKPEPEAPPLSTAKVEVAEPPVDHRRPNTPDLPSVVIAGQGCILPGGACSPEQLSQAIMQRKMGIVDQRNFDPHWEADFYSEELVPDRSTTHLTGRVNDSDMVAPDGIDPHVFRQFTRSQQLLCIALAPCISALRAADRIMCVIGATADGFEDQDVVSSLRYAGIDPTDPHVDAKLNTARSAFQDPHDAVQEVFDRVVRPGLQVTLIDAACASSLYAIALGMHALEENVVDAVVAGGVFCPGPGNSCLFSQFRGTSSTGVRPFDAAADGVVFSEGAAVVVLRRAADTERLGLPTVARLRGVGLSSDGRSPSASVPQTQGQILSLHRCYDSYGIDPASVRAIEGHGTGTPVGDQTEMETLRQFLTDRVTKPVLLHSLKGLLGHSGWAAGAASVIAVAEYLRHGWFPAQACHEMPSEALLKSAGLLSIPRRAVQLPTGHCQIAVDGFGFGGANAHIVMDRYIPSHPGDDAPADSAAARPTPRDETVIVAFDEIRPATATSSPARFERDKVTIPDGYVVLPDVADDMDISQTLALALADKVLSQLSELDEATRREIGVIVAQNGKSERGVEATMHVLTPRFRRILSAHTELLNRLDTATKNSRPSGPYTLQCMMPNVSAGRVAQLLNLNGPNFAVDAGNDSLEAALTAARLILQGGNGGGTKLVLLMAIAANPWRASDQRTETTAAECAAVFAVTTRRFATQHGLTIVADVDDALQPGGLARTAGLAVASTAANTRQLLDTLAAPARSDAPAVAVGDGDDSVPPAEFPIYVPTWVEAPLATDDIGRNGQSSQAILAIVPPDHEQITDLIRTLPSYSCRFLVVVAGSTADDVALAFNDRIVVSVDMRDAGAIERTLAKIRDFAPDLVVAVESVQSWNGADTLAKVATDNSLCELLFLVAQRNVERLRAGEIDVWALFLDAWNGVVHPVSGAASGLLKAVKREIPAAGTAVICTRGLTLNAAFERLLAERAQHTGEQELVVDGERRLVRRLRQSAVSESATSEAPALNANSVVVAAGGARGVTSVLVDALCRDYGCTVVALGRTQLVPGAGQADVSAPDEREFYNAYLRAQPNATAAEMKSALQRQQARWETQQTISRLSSAGGRVEYISVDVTDRDQVDRAVGEIAAKYARIDLLLYGAGVQLSKRLEQRSLADFRRTFAVKVRGFHNLVAACRAQFGNTVDAHALTSAYSVFGNDGQHDYGAANETLDRLCGLAHQQGNACWSSIAWLAWDGIGMTRGSEYRALAKQRKLSAVTFAGGQQIFRNVVIRHPIPATSVPLSHAEHVRYEVKTVPPSTLATTGRLLEMGLELSTIECLAHHKVRSTPTLPGAWILERMASAALQFHNHAASTGSITFQDIIFQRFVRLAAGREPNLRIVVEDFGDRIDAWMIGDILHSSGVTLAKDILFAQARLILNDTNAEIQSILSDTAFSSNQGAAQFVNDPYCDGRRTDVQLSGPFDCLRDIAIGPDGRCAKVAASDDHDSASVIPTLLLDSAWRVGAMYAVPGNDVLYVPARIGQIIAPVGARANGPAKAQFEIRATAPRVENGHACWDRTEVLNANGQLSMVVENALAAQLR